MASVSRVFIFVFILSTYFTNLNCEARLTSSSHHSSSHSSSHSHPSHTSHVSTHSNAHSGSGHHSYPSSSHLSGSGHHSSSSSILSTSHGHTSSSVGHQSMNSGSSGSGHYSTSLGNSGTFPQHASYPSSSGLSGAGQKSSSSSSSIISSQHPSYPATSGLSGTGHTSSSSSSFGTSLYPSSNGLSGSAHQSSSSSKFGSAQQAAYPSSSGLSGSGQPSDSSINLGTFQFHSVHGVSGPFSDTSSKSPNSGHSYASSNGLSGSKSKGGNSLSGISIQNKPPQIVIPSFPTQNKLPSQFGSQGISSVKPVHKNPSSDHMSGTGIKISINSPTHQNTANSKDHHIHHQNTTIIIHHHHHHYNYNYQPPKAIYYTPTHGHHQVSSYPVYIGTPPSYVYEYKSSGSRYSNLLAGLALYNLGKTSVNPHLHNYNKNYKPLQNEICVFGVQYNNGNYEEMSVDCRTITYFIWDQEYGSILNKTNQIVVTNTTTVTQNLTQIGLPQNLFPNGIIGNVLQNQTNSFNNNTILPNGTLVNINASNTLPSLSNILPISNNFIMLPNGTLVQKNYSLDISQLLKSDPYVSSPVMLPNGTLIPNNVNTKPAQSSLPQPNVMAPNGTLIPNNNTTSTMIINTSTVQVTSAMDVKYKGQPIQVTTDMDCYVKRITPYSMLRQSVPCGLLDTYSSQSLRKNLATRTTSKLSLLAIILFTYFYL